jgi:hypothetical protein
MDCHRVLTDRQFLKGGKVYREIARREDLAWRRVREGNAEVEVRPAVDRYQLTRDPQLVYRLCEADGWLIANLFVVGHVDGSLISVRMSARYRNRELLADSSEEFDATIKAVSRTLGFFTGTASQ